MNEVTKYLTNIGLAPVIIVFIGLCILLVKTYVNHELHKERKRWEEELKFLSERHVARSRLLEELNGLVHDFDHYVNHVFEGDGGWYKEAIDEKYKEIRSLARNRIELVPDFPAFEETIYKFTENGRAILVKQFDFEAYKESKEKLTHCISNVRETLPGMAR